MTEVELREIISSDENQTVEFKLESEKQQSLAEVLGALANARGGWLLVGVTDEGEINGVSRPKLVVDRLHSAASSVEPPLLGRVTVEIVSTTKGTVVAAQVPDGLMAIHSVGGVYRLRVGSYNKILTFDQAQALAYRRGILHYEQNPLPSLELNNLDKETIDRYMGLRLKDYVPGSYPKLSRFELMRNLGCAVEENGRQFPSVLAGLFFSSTPDFFIPAAQIIAARFEGINSDRVLDRQTIRGPLPQLIDNTARFVQRNIRVRLELPEEPGESMAAQDVLEYPLAAIREMIVNMVAHRDYYNVVPSHLMIFDDRIVVENPGGLLPGLSLKMLENRHRPRNPRLIEMLHTMGYVERFGSGIGRMRRAMQEAKLPEPLFEADESYFRVTLRNSPAKIEVAVALPGNPPSKTALAETPVAPAGREAVLLKRLPLARLKNRQVEALRYIMRQGKINNAQYRALTGLAVDATLNDLRELLDLKLVIKVGVTGRAVYYILNPELEKD